MDYTSGVGNGLFAAVLSISIAIQVTAAVYALLNVRYTRDRLAWVLVAAAIVLMAVRRIITLSGMIAAWETPRAVSWSAEITALVISILMVTGMILINRMVKSAASELSQQRSILRESLHTSKNNLMSLASLLRVQADFAENPETRAFTHELEQKVSAYALLQKQLFDNEGGPDIRSYLSELIATIQAAYRDPRRFAPVEHSIEPFDASARDALYAGLVVTEALINAYKYSHDDQPITVQVKTAEAEDGRRILEVHDSGQGYPPEVLQGRRSGFGLTFLRSLNAGDWTVEFGNDSGAWVRACF
jgi:two-component sensor histidine kinase